MCSVGGMATESCGDRVSVRMFTRSCRIVFEDVRRRKVAVIAHRIEAREKFGRGRKEVGTTVPGE